MECTALESLGGAEARLKILRFWEGSRVFEEGYAEVGTHCPHLELVAGWLAGWLAGCRQQIQHTNMRQQRVPLERKCVEHAYP